jgi:hypothetical protein
MDDILDPSFDPQKLNITSLVRILARFDVDLPPSKEKKAYYVNLFNDHLDYMKKRLQSDLKKSAKKPPKTGIFAEISNQKGTDTGSGTDQKLKITDSPDSSKGTPSKASSRQTRERGKDLQQTSTPQLKSTPKKRSAAAAVESDQDSESPFTSENIFQSPKTTPIATPSKTKQSPFVPKVVFDKVEQVPIEFSSEKPEFKTPSKPAQSLKSKSINDKKPASIHERLLRRNKQRQEQRLVNGILLGMVSIFFFVTVHWLIVDYPNLQYCSNVTTYKPFYPFSSQCIPCPSNAICSSRAVTGCIGSDTKLKKSLFQKILPSFLSLFPYNQPSCVFDGGEVMDDDKRQRQVDHLVKVTDHLVREYIGKAMCSKKGFPSTIFKSGNILGMPVSKAKSELHSMIGTKWSRDKFEEFWGLMVENVAKNPNTLKMVVDNQNRFFNSENPPIASYWCTIKQAMWKSVVQNAVYLVTLGACVLGGMGFWVSYQKRQFEAEVVSSLLPDIISAIHQETENYHSYSSRHPVPGLALSQVKDHFLPLPISNSKEFQVDGEGRAVWSVYEPSRSRIWKKITDHISKNTNIRQTTTQIKGETNVVWFWVGSAALTPCAKKRKSDGGGAALEI